MKYATKIKMAVASALCVMVGMGYAYTVDTEVPIYGATFESAKDGVVNDYDYTNGHSITEYTNQVAVGTDAIGTIGWFAGSEDDESVITNLQDGVQGQVLRLNTEAEILTNKLSTANANAVKAALTIDAAHSDDSYNSGDSIGTYQGTVFESDVKFVASDTLDPGITGGTDATKFAIYAYCDDSTDGNPTNLVVYHAFNDNGTPAYTNEVFEDVLIDTTVFTHLRVEMKKYEFDGDYYNVFSVSVNGGEPLSSDTAFDAAAEGNPSGIWFLTTEIIGDDTVTDIKSLNFKGTGEIDNIKISQKVQETYAAIVDGIKYASWSTAAAAAIAGDKTLESYTAGQSIELAAETHIAVTNEQPTVTTVSGYKVVTSGPVDGVYTYTSVLDKATVLFVAYNGDILYSNDFTIGTAPSYVGADPTKPADASGIYTWNGWTSGGVDYGKTGPFANVAVGGATYTATFSSVASVASVNGVYYASLQDALDAIATANPYEAEISLCSNATITISQNGNVLGGSNTTNITINGNAKTLNVIRNGTWAQFNTANNAKLVLNNVNLTSEFTGTMTEWTSEPLQNPNHNVAFNCDVELNNVYSDTALSFWKDAALDTVTIEETVDVYSIWIHTTAGNVSIKDLVVNTSTGRGIKVDDSFVRAAQGRTPAATTISIDGAAFTTKNKKSAILVRSAYAVTITADNYDISGVPADTTNLVWVDEDASQYYGQITLNGTQPGIEGGVSSYAASYSEDGSWIDGYYKTLEGAVAVADADDTVTLQKDVTETLAVSKAMTITRNGFSAPNVTAGSGYFLNESNSAYVFIAGAKATVISVADGSQTYYGDLAAAVAAATDGDTVKLLDDVTLTARVEPNLGAGTDLTIDLGGYTITRTGTSGNGSAFDIKSGNVVITNGTITCTQDDTAIAKDGVYAITSRDGSNVTLADLVVLVNSECGACAYPFAGSTMTIESGAYSNLTQTAYRYNTAITGMAVNQPNNATQNLFINGGTFSQYDPQLGDDSGAMTDFTAEGFVAIADGNGGWVVQEGYNVTFDANGGSPVPEAQRVAKGGKATAPAAPAKAGSVFTGWTLSGAAYDFDTVLSADITLVAAYDGAKATVITITDAGATTNVVGYYATVTAALEAAATGDTVVVLADTYERVYATVNNNVTLDINGATMTSPVDDVIVKNGSGTLTIVDTAATPGLVQSTINGVDLGVAVWARQGKVIINSGVFENNSNYEATLYVSNGAYAEVNGGTFRNVADGTYHWNTAWDPINLNIQNGHADKANAIVVSGGSFSTDPQLGDDSLHGDGDFTDDGYVGIEEGGVFVVQPGYNVTFDANGGSPTPDAQRVAAGDAAVEPTEPTKASDGEYNYTFSAWQLNGADYDFVDPIAADCTLVAVYDATPISTAITYPDSDTEIPAGGLLDWITDNGFDQDAVDAAGTTEKLTECYLLNCTPGTGNGGTLSITAIQVVGSEVRVTVKLERTGAIGAINGTLYVSGTAALGGTFADVASVTFSDADFSEGDTTTAAFTDGTKKFFKAVIK